MKSQGTHKDQDLEEKPVPMKTTPKLYAQCFQDAMS